MNTNIFFSIIISINLASRLTLPIINLIGAAEKISTGDLNAKVPKIDTDDEFKDFKCINSTDSVSANTSCAAMVIAAALAAGDTAVEIRLINIYLDGEMVNDSATTKSLTGVVKVRNNRIFTQ